ncbi:MAG TPA: hypothetical protein VGN61_04115 [Verrucomicrobiae bacterium]
MRPVRRAIFPGQTAASPRTLREAIQAAAESIEDESLDLLWPDNALTPNQARSVLASLTLCYARQIYKSTDAAIVVARDLSFPCLYAGKLPDAPTLRRFRAVNTDALRRCLTAALHFLVEQKVFSGFVTRADLPQLAEEAGRRIIVAMFVDSLKLDGE